uniref:Uncharacterized protein n=1 Tax=Pyxicephalus adspersus TaxID=30357 RepID=A0AAV3AI02_PYXAD|nr:TPA: hypothetical protein GDO54_011543 [Pyxicephalus adspersus]
MARGPQNAPYNQYQRMKPGGCRGSPGREALVTSVDTRAPIFGLIPLDCNNFRVSGNCFAGKYPEAAIATSPLPNAGFLAALFPILEQ